MLLLNRGMMQFIKHPLHRNDLLYTSSISTYFTTGSDPTENEIVTANNIASAGGFSEIAMRNTLVGSRVIVASGYSWSSSDVVNARPKKAHGVDPNTFVLRAAESPFTVTVSTSGTVTRLQLVIYGYNGISGQNLGRAALSMSVGLPGSGADIEMEKVDYVAGERIKLNDIVINIQNLLGEA